MTRAAARRKAITRARRLVWMLRGDLPNVEVATGHLVEAWTILAELDRQQDEDVVQSTFNLAKVVVQEWAPAAFRYCTALEEGERRATCERELGEIVNVFGRWLLDAEAAGWLRTDEAWDAEAMRACVEGLPQALAAKATAVP